MDEFSIICIILNILRISKERGLKTSLFALRKEGEILMSFYWESATKELQKELNDPLLRVEFDEITQKYEILKWMPRTQYQDVPGYLLGSKEKTVRIGFSSGYYSLQTTFDEWDGRVIEALRKGRPDRKSAKEIINELKQDNEYVKKSLKKEMNDLDREVAFDIHKRLCPTIYSYAKAVG